MTLELYIEQLQKFVEKYPEALKFHVVHSSDDEGSSFHSVQFSPTLGAFDEDKLTFDAHRELNYESNSVCIN
jgi:hypothetical protein